MDVEERDHFTKLRCAHVKRLRVLELKQAKMGLHTPEHILTEIDELSEKIADIDVRLNGAGTVSLSSTVVVNSSPLKNSAAETAQIDIVFRGDFAALTLELQECMIRVLAALVDLPPDQIKVVKAMKGSIILRVEMPKEAADRLLELHKSQDPDIEDAEIADIRSVQAPATISPRRPDGELSKERNWLHAAMQITEVVSTTLDLDETFREIMGTLRNLFPHATPCVLLYLDTEHTLVFPEVSQKFYQIDSPMYKELTQVSVDGPSIASVVARASLSSHKTEEAVIDSVETEPHYLKLKSETRSELCVSLVSEGRLQGVLLLESRQQDAFSGEDVAFIRFVARHVSIALDRAYQSREARRDSTFAALRAWAAGIAHDVNRDLKYILNRTYFISQDPQLPERSRTFIEEIEASLYRISEAFQELEPQQTQEQDTIALGSWLQRQVETIVPPGSDIHVQYVLHDDQMEIRTYPVSLKRVLHHLIRNAVNAMEGKGILTIRTQQQEGFVEMQIEVDVPDNLRQNLYDRQLIFKGPLVGGSGSGGLGLLLVSLDIEKLGGSLHLPSREDDREAVFAFRLPLDKSEIS